MYIDKTYYDAVFKGEKIPDNKFNRLADIASDVIDTICTIPINKEEEISDDIKKATAYQTEMLHLQGGIEAITGMAESIAVGSESLGGYSVSAGSSNGNQSILFTKGGIPISPLAVSILKKAGYICRWAYAERKKNG